MYKRTFSWDYCIYSEPYSHNLYELLNKTFIYVLI